jgi:tetratricopeptide (TPR) repeat protein
MTLITRVATLLAIVALCACTLPPPALRPPANAAVVLSPSQLIAAVQADTDRIDHSKDPGERTRLLATATANAQQCLAQAPDNGACHYAWAQVLGLTARERPVQAVALLKQMLASLKQAEMLDPSLDHSGPARLTATVLLRAPGWPLGPGDADAALVAAQRAVDREPAYPPNLITLAQAQAKTDATDKARASYEQARLAVMAWNGATPEAAADRAQWQQELEQGLRDLR